MGTFRDACLENAADQIKAGRAMYETGRVPHLVYHMATLALEEIGKSHIHTMGRLAQDIKGDDTWSKNQLDDHEKKLFWSLWGMSMTKEVITPKQMEDFRGLAKLIHDKRLNFLYVSDETPPRDKVSAEEALNILELAESRLELERHYEPSERTPEQIANSEWVFDLINDKEERKFVLGKESMEKMVELGSVSEWFMWLRKKFDQRNAELADLMKKEMARSPDEGDKTKLKWRIMVTLDCVSHSVREKDLSAFSKVVERIKMTRGKTDKQIKAHFLFDEAVPIKELWGFGHAWISRFVIALNVATMGYIWWNIPDEPDKYFGAVENMKDKLNVSIRPNDGHEIKLDFGKGVRMEVLKKGDLLRAVNFMVVLSHFKSDEMKKVGAFTMYRDAIAVMSKCDVHYNEVPRAFAEMCKAVHALFDAYGDWDGKSPFLDSLRKKASEWPLDIQAEFTRLVGVGIDLLSRKQIPYKSIPTADQFMRLKLLFDMLATQYLQGEWTAYYEKNKHGPDAPEVVPAV